MKVSTRTIMKILRLYGVADDHASPRDLRRVVTRDHESFVQTSCLYQNNAYAFLLGSVVDEEVIDDLWPDRPTDAQLKENPLDPLTHTTPFQGKYVLFFTIPPRTQRLDTYLAQELDPSRSRSAWQKHIKAGHVLVNGQPVLSPKVDIRSDDAVEVHIPDAPQQDHEVAMLYQDEDVMVVDKPAGMLTHAKGGIMPEHTVADYFLPHTAFATDSHRAGVVHRLDRDTSGVLIGARHEEAAVWLQRQFANRTVQKTYVAVVEGCPALREATIDLPIARHPSRPSQFRVDANGKSAQTTYTVLATDGERSLVLLRPKTGRTHQLRVHLSHIGTPIMGDRVYGVAAERLMLHAYQLTLTLPSGVEKTFTAAIPPAFTALFPDGVASL